MKALILSLAILIPGVAQAADQRARVDINGNPTQLGVSATTGEIRRILVNENGAPIFASTGTVSVLGSTVNVTNVAGTSLDVNITGGSLTAGVSGSTVHVINEDGGTLSVDDGAGSLTVDASDLDIRDLTFAADKVDVSGSILGANSGVDIGDVTIDNAAGASAVNIQDGGNSITVDFVGAISVFGSSVSVTNVDGTSLSIDDNGGSITVDGTIAATQSGTWILGVNSGVDIGDVTINNAGAGAAVNIQDGGNSITVDGTVAATQSGTWILGANDGVDIGDTTNNNAGGASAVNIQDGGNSITIDGTVSGTGVFNVFGSSVSVDNVDGTSLSVDDNGGSLTVDATQLDIDDLTFAADKVDASGSTLGANDGVDVGDVTINNAGAGAAVNIQDGGNSITVDGTVTADAGAGIYDVYGASVSVDNVDGTSLAVDDNGGSLTVDATQLDVDDLTFAADKVDTSGSTLGANSGVDIGDVTIDNMSGGAAVNIQDGGNVISIDDGGGNISIDDGGNIISIDDGGTSLTVDAVDLDIRDLTSVSDSVSVFGSSVSVDNVDGTSLSIDDGGNIITVDGTIAATQSGTWILGANSGVDIGDVTIDNAAGASAVNIQDGGNVISIDDGGSTVSIDDGGGTITVDGTVNVNDGGGSLTVDAVNFDIRDLTFAADKVDASGSTLGANSGVDIGDVTINNAAAGAAVNIQDGGNVISIDDGGATISIDDGGGVITVDGTVTPDASGNDTPFISSHPVSGSTVEVMAANANRESSLICNEGPEIARVGDAANLTSSVGQRLLVDQCYTPDGPSKPFRGAYSAISVTGSPTKITVTEGS